MGCCDKTNMELLAEEASFISLVIEIELAMERDRGYLEQLYQVWLERGLDVAEIEETNVLLMADDRVCH